MDELTKDDLNRYSIAADKSAEVGRSYVAIDQRTGKPAWVRLVTASSDAESLTMLKHDLHIAVGLEHPNLVKLVNYGIFDREVVAIYEFVPGISLREIATGTDAPVRKQIVERVAPPLIVGVQAMHEKKIAHWGIDPTNVLVTPAGEVKIADVGLAATYRDHLKNVAPYLALPAPPELTRGNPLIVSDYYSVSTTLMQVAGELADEVLRTAVRLPALGLWGAVVEMFDYINSLRKRGGTFKQLPKPLGQILQRFLSLDPEQRKMTEEDIRLLESYTRAQRPAVSPQIASVEDQIVMSPPYRGTLLTEMLRSRKRTQIDERLSETRRMIAEAVVKTMEVKAEAETKEAEVSGRFVNVWTDADTPELEVGDRWYTLSLQIATTADRRTVAPFAEPALDGQQVTDLLVSFYSDDLEIKTLHQTISLPAAGKSGIAQSLIRPRHGGTCKIEIIISLARELEILQVVEVDITAEVTAAEVVPVAV